jgi:hypothetical protein
MHRQLLSDDEDENDHEGQVDEVHGFDQADRQEQDREELRAGFGLPRHTSNRLGAGKTVTDGRTDSTATQQEATADEGPGRLDGRYEFGICCHFFSSVGGSGGGASGAVAIVAFGARSAWVPGRNRTGGLVHFFFFFLQREAEVQDGE